MLLFQILQLRSIIQLRILEQHILTLILWCCQFCLFFIKTQSAIMNYFSLFMNESLLRMFQLTETGWWWIRFNSLLCFYTYYTHFTDLCAAQLSMHRLLKSNDWILSPHQLQPSSAINHWNNLIQLRLLKVPN